MGPSAFAKDLVHMIPFVQQHSESECLKVVTRIALPVILI